MLAAPIVPLRQGSSPIDSNARPQRGSRTRLMAGPRSTLVTIGALRTVEHSRAGSHAHHALRPQGGAVGGSGRSRNRGWVVISENPSYPRWWSMPHLRSLGAELQEQAIPYIRGVV